MNETWYVHVIGPDDIEGPFDGFGEAMKYAMELNASAWTGRKYRPEVSPTTWAVPTRSVNGVMDA